MAVLIDSKHIAGVKFVQLQPHADDRGRFMETFRTGWFPERNWAVVQANRSDSQAGVLRGLHYHLHQVDYWCPAWGQLRVGLADLRRGSPSFGAGQVIEMSAARPMGLFIPPGVAHGYLALSEVTLLYWVDRYYDPSDELGVAWNDPTLNLAWGVTDPILSPRDQALPLLSAIDPATLP
jgi:dTDP-4-dehydrorhamnose 3,5-epimerase